MFVSICSNSTSRIPAASAELSSHGCMPAPQAGGPWEASEPVQAFANEPAGALAKLVAEGGKALLPPMLGKLLGAAVSALGAVQLAELSMRAGNTAGHRHEETITAYPPGHPAAIERGSERAAQTWQQAEQPGFPATPSPAPDEGLGGSRPSSKRISTAAADPDRARAQAEIEAETETEKGAEASAGLGKRLYGVHAIEDTTGFHGPGLPVMKDARGTLVRDMRNEVCLEVTREGPGGEPICVATKVGAPDTDGWASTPIGERTAFEALPPHYMGLWIEEGQLETSSVLMNRQARVPVVSSFTYEDGKPVLLFGGHSREAYTTSIQRALEAEYEARGFAFEMPRIYRASLVTDQGSFLPSRLAHQPGFTEDRENWEGQVRRYIVGSNHQQMTSALAQIRRDEPGLPDEQAINRAFQQTSVARLAELMGYSTEVHEPKFGPRSIQVLLHRRE